LIYNLTGGEEAEISGHINSKAAIDRLFCERTFIMILPARPVTIGAEGKAKVDFSIKGHKTMGLS